MKKQNKQNLVTVKGLIAALFMLIMTSCLVFFTGCVSVIVNFDEEGLHEGDALPAITSPAKGTVEWKNPEETLKGGTNYYVFIHTAPDGTKKEYKTEITATEHVFSSWEIEKEPTCTELGFRHRLCDVCGKSYSLESIEALGHDFTISNHENGTCIEKGYTFMTCSRCGENETENGELVKHYDTTYGEHQWETNEDGSFVISKIEVAATCQRAGKGLVNCKLCDEKKEVEIPKTGHVYTQVITQVATCRNYSKYVYQCQWCVEEDPDHPGIYRGTTLADHHYENGICTNLYINEETGRVEQCQYSDPDLAVYGVYIGGDSSYNEDGAAHAGTYSDPAHNVMILFYENEKDPYALDAVITGSGRSFSVDFPTNQNGFITNLDDLVKEYFGSWKNYRSIKTLSVSEDVESLPEGLFYGVSSLEKINFLGLSKMTEIPSSCFRGCRGLDTLFLSDKLKVIGDSAFRDCGSLTGFKTVLDLSSNGLVLTENLVFPKDLEVISDYAFFYSALEYVNLNGTKIAEIGYNAIPGDVEYVALPNGNVKVVLGGKSGTDSNAAGSFSAKNNAIYVEDEYSADNSNEIWAYGSNVYYLGSDKTYKNRVLKTSSGIHYIVATEESPVYVKKFIVTGKSDYAKPYQLYKYTDGVIITKVINKKLTDEELTAFLSLDINGKTAGEQIKMIGAYAFYGCSAITSFNLSLKAENIGAHAFDGCTSLKTFTIAENGSLSSIDDFAFKNTVIEAITLPSTVVYVGTSVVSDSASLKTVNYNIPEVKGSGVMPDGTVAERLSLYGFFYSSNNNFAYGDFTVNFGEAVKVIPSGMFNSFKANSLTVSFEDGCLITEIAPSAFSSGIKCAGDVKIDLSGATELQTLGDSSLSGATEVILPSHALTYTASNSLFGANIKRVVFNGEFTTTYGLFHYNAKGYTVEINAKIILESSTYKGGAFLYVKGTTTAGTADSPITVKIASGIRELPVLYNAEAGYIIYDLQTAETADENGYYGYNVIKSTLSGENLPEYVYVSENAFWGDQVENKIATIKINGEAATPSHVHDYVEVSRTEATCTSTGSVTYKCSDENCGNEYTEVLPKTEHEWLTDDKGNIIEYNRKDATCTEYGITFWDEYSVVRQCANETFKYSGYYNPSTGATENVTTNRFYGLRADGSWDSVSYPFTAPLGHSPVSGYYTSLENETVATCKDNGSQGYYVTVCSREGCYYHDYEPLDYEERTINLPHDYDSDNVCKVCGKTKTADPISFGDLTINFQSLTAEEKQKLNLSGEWYNAVITGKGATPTYTSTTALTTNPLIKNSTLVYNIYKLSFDTTEEITINAYAFAYTMIREVEIPSNVKISGTYAFAYNRMLRTVRIGDGVTLPGNTFRECTNLNTLYASSKTTLTKDFTNDYHVMNVYVDNVLTNVSLGTSSTDTNMMGGEVFDQGDFVFYKKADVYYLIGYTGMDTDLILPVLKVNGEAVTYVVYQRLLYSGDVAYTLNDSNGIVAFQTTSIYIPDNAVTEIQTYAFAYYDRQGKKTGKISSVYIGEGVTTIGDYAFRYINGSSGNVTKLVLPATIKMLSQYALSMGSSSTFLKYTYFKYIYYKGTAEDWAAIDNSASTDLMGKITVYYFVANVDDCENYVGNYWTYVNGKIAILTGSHKLGELVEVVTAPTCTEAGEGKYICTLCGKEVISVIPALGHSYGDDDLCTRCGEKKPSYLYQFDYGNTVVTISEDTVNTGYYIMTITAKAGTDGKMLDVDDNNIANWAYGNGLTGDTNYYSKKFSLVNIEQGVTNIGEGAFYLMKIAKIKIPIEVTEIGAGAFYDGVYGKIDYAGTEEQWSAITKGSYNYGLEDATINYNVQ